MFPLRLFALGSHFLKGYQRQHVVKVVSGCGHRFSFAHLVNKSGLSSNALGNSDLEGVWKVPDDGDGEDHGTEVRRLKGNMCDVKDEEKEGVHIPVMVNEVLMALAPQPGEVREYVCQVCVCVCVRCVIIACRCNG